MSDELVRVEALGKRFRLYSSPWDRAREWASFGRRPRHTDVWAFRGVSFSLKRGECFGVIGPNGSGKSTLLKVLSSVLTPTEGRFQVRTPHFYSLLELGTGFHPDLTGRENLRESARLLGLPDEYLAAETVEEIRAFADIGDYFDRPIRFYSSGMHVRLAFSLFAFLRTELLVVDEALSVGDIFFQQKCMERIDAMQTAGTSFLFVSHDMESVRRLCTETLVLNEGSPIFLGPTSEAVNRYYGLVNPAGFAPTAHLRPRAAESREGMNAEAIAHGDILAGAGRRHGEGGLEVLAARVTDEAGQDVRSAPVRGLLNFDLLIEAHRSVAFPSAGLALYDRLGNLVFAAGAGSLRHQLPPLDPGQRLIVRLGVRMSLHPGPYTLVLGASEHGRPQDWHESLGPIEVFRSDDGPPTFYGIADLPITCHHVMADLESTTAV